MAVDEARLEQDIHGDFANVEALLSLQKGQAMLFAQNDSFYVSNIDQNVVICS